MILSESDIADIKVRGYHTETECMCGSDVPMLLESHEELRTLVNKSAALHLCDEGKKVSDKLKIAVEALEFYADRGDPSDWDRDLDSLSFRAVEALKIIRGEK